jgi:hypothetical protein
VRGGEGKQKDEPPPPSGTPNYAAPECFAEEEETAAIDVYGLAATTYLMLTARLPFGVGDALAILSRQLDAPPPAPSTIRAGLPEAVDVVIGKAMAVEPARRFATPGAFAAALRAALRGAEPGGRATARPAEVGQLRELTIEVEGLTEAPDAEAAALIRGAALRVAARVLAARVGEPWLRRVAEVRPELAGGLRPGLPPMAWRPLAELIELVGSATGDIDTAEIMRTVGRGLVSVTFGVLYGADPASMSTHGLLAMVPQLWGRYFGGGRCEAIGVGDGRAVLAVTSWSAAEPAEDLVAGFLERIAELTGAGGVRVASARDPEMTTFTVEWSP